jgi:hypothetical protein
MLLRTVIKSSFPTSNPKNSELHFQLPYSYEQSNLVLHKESKAKAEADGRYDWQDGWINLDVLKETVLDTRGEFVLTK